MYVTYIPLMHACIDTYHSCMHMHAFSHTYHIIICHLLRIMQISACMHQYTYHCIACTHAGIAPSFMNEIFAKRVVPSNTCYHSCRHCMHACMQAYIPLMNACMHTYIPLVHAWIHTYHSCMHGYIHNTRACMHACRHTLVHACIHT